MDLTPGPESKIRSEAITTAACKLAVHPVLALLAVQDDGAPEAEDQIRDCAAKIVDAILPVAYRAGREDAAPQAEIDRLLRGTGYEVDEDNPCSLAAAVDAVLAAFEERRQIAINLGRSAQRDEQDTQSSPEWTGRGIDPSTIPQWEREVIERTFREQEDCESSPEVGRADE